MVMVPSTSPNTPRTFVTMRWRATKPIDECEASIVQVPGAMVVADGCVSVVAMGFLPVVWWRARGSRPRASGVRDGGCGRKDHKVIAVATIPDRCVESARGGSAVVERRRAEGLACARRWDRLAHG